VWVRFPPPAPKRKKLRAGRVVDGRRPPSCNENVLPVHQPAMYAPGLDANTGGGAPFNGTINRPSHSRSTESFRKPLRLGHRMTTIRRSGPSPNDRVADGPRGPRLLYRRQLARRATHQRNPTPLSIVVGAGHMVPGYGALLSPPNARVTRTGTTTVSEGRSA